MSSNKNILICGSLAYDNIMVFQDHFTNHILPDQIHILNVSFVVPQMRKEFGGCAGNIAYNLKLLGEDPLIMATVGACDSAAYFERLQTLGISQQYIKNIPDSFTAQAFIISDLSNNQMNAFHPGAMEFANQVQITADMNLDLAIVSPNHPGAMKQQAANLSEFEVPFIFDPGQSIPAFSGEELLDFLDIATYSIMNDYEAKVMMEKTGYSMKRLADEVDVLIVTTGEEGSQMYLNGESKPVHIPCVKAKNELDPTGCGDAYRAGILFALANDLDWQTAGQLGSVMGAIKIASQGGQNHFKSMDEIRTIYKTAFPNGKDF